MCISPAIGAKEGIGRKRKQVARSRRKQEERESLRELCGSKMTCKYKIPALALCGWNADAKVSSRDHDSFGPEFIGKIEMNLRLVLARVLPIKSRF